MGAGASSGLTAEIKTVMASVSGLDEASRAKINAAIEASSSSIDTLQAQVSALQEKVTDMSAQLARRDLKFSIAQYNILAGYLGNNMEPWFLYGVDMPAERRDAICKKHVEKDAEGKYVNVGWPNYVKGILTDDEIATVEAVHARDFAWDARKHQLMATIRELDADVLSLVECDHFEDFFKAELWALGYDTMWSKRPRPNSDDGCCIAWKRHLFVVDAPTAVEEYVDRYDAATNKTYKDRIALLVLLRLKGTSQSVLVVSTHLTRNPEDPKMDSLRAKQIGQVLRRITTFTAEQACTQHTPVVLAGDLNATSFQKLRGIANAVTLMVDDDANAKLHPFTFDCKEVPTGKTSVTAARDVRIDALLFQSQKLMLVDSKPAKQLRTPIPDSENPSDRAQRRSLAPLPTRTPSLASTPSRPAARPLSTLPPSPLTPPAVHAAAASLRAQSCQHSRSPARPPLGTTADRSLAQPLAGTTAA